MSIERKILSEICEKLIRCQEIEAEQKKVVFGLLGLLVITVKCWRCDKTMTVPESFRGTDLKCYRKDGRLVLEGSMTCECGGLMYGTVEEGGE